MNLFSGLKGKGLEQCLTKSLSRSATYIVWNNMMQRCHNPSNTNYVKYGERGIKVCERWHLYKNFLADMGERPDGKTLDRYPNKNGNYEKENCRWATVREQNLNQNTRKDNSSGCRGVSFVKKANTWRARVHVFGKTILLYNGPSYEEAVKLRKNWESEHVK